MSHRRAAGGGEVGSATPVLLSMCMVLMLFAVAAVDVGVIVASRARAQVAADLAALAALVPAARPPSQLASEIAKANGARLVGCACGSASAVVVVERAVQLPILGHAVVVPARARAVTPTAPLFPSPPADDVTPPVVPPGRGPAAVRALLANPRLELTSNARADLAGGVVDERLIALLDLTLRKHRVAVSVFQTGHTRYVAGTRVVSKHAYGRAMDIYKVDGGLVRPSHQPSLRLVAWLATLGPPLRPSEVGSPFPSFTQAPGHFSDRAHLDHVHVAVG